MTPTRRAVMAGLAAAPLAAASARGTKHPRAIAMWDFSWLERRWPGAGYEDWDRALDELAARGYDAVRIDAYPHLIAAGGERAWTLAPWGDAPWGAPGRVTVRVLPALTTFIAAAHRRGIRVALSTWFRRDATDARMRLTTPRAMADAWIAAVAAIDRAGLLDAIVYVDLCNEWPASLWAPFLQPPQGWGDWPNPPARAWMNAALDAVRGAYPQLPLCFSSDRVDGATYLQHDVSRLDLIEQHVWMAKQDGEHFIRAVQAATAAVAARPWYDRLAAAGAPLYRARKAEWDGLLTARVAELANVSRQLNKPLATTECWAIVNAVDWPDADWSWIKESCAVGVAAAAASGRWLAIATSNFCGPQSVWMWRDVAWHRRQTAVIRHGTIDADLRGAKLYERL